MHSSARSLIATATATKTCVFANALESCRRATPFYCCGQVGCQEYSEFSNSTLLISSAPGIGTNRQLGISRNSEYQPKTSVKDRHILRLTVLTEFHYLTAILAHPHQIEVVTAKRVEMRP